MPLADEPSSADVRRDVDEVLLTFLAERRREAAVWDPRAATPVDEIQRLLLAGGRRLRPMCCVWGYRAVAPSESSTNAGDILRAAAALELLHTMALIHDDLMDGADRRRGVAASAPHLEATLGPGAVREPGTAVALLAGDLAAVFADRLLLSSGFGADRLLPALERYATMRTEMGVGQFLDVTGAVSGRTAARLVADLKGGRYTIGGPLAIGATLGGGSPAQLSALGRFAEPLGLAFQLRDDLEDGDAETAPTVAEIVALVDRSQDALRAAETLEPAAVDALLAIADAVRPGSGVRPPGATVS
jgi:geranylgeranyl diphosphate synthase type I